MRLSAYKKAIDEATQLPVCVPELAAYFKSIYSPRIRTIDHIVELARKDERLFHGEFCELYKYASEVRR